ncbi:MAG: SelB C-terminal domain-containing protein [Desulfomicrobium escambiense]|nr:SelB C-terminal domain-containing protein [Desulfomicrobium escambiense]
MLSRRKADFIRQRRRNRHLRSYYSQQSEDLIVHEYQRPTMKKIPLQAGISKEELKAALGRPVSAKLFNMALRCLGKKETIVLDKDNVRLAAHRVQMTGNLDSIRLAVLGIYQKAGLTPPALAEVIAGFKDQKAPAQSIIKLLVKNGDLIKINEDLLFYRESLEQLRKDYKALLIKDGKAAPSSFKELTNLSRKYIIPLMEWYVGKLTLFV